MSIEFDLMLTITAALLLASFAKFLLMNTVGRILGIGVTRSSSVTATVAKNQGSAQAACNQPG